MMSTKIQRTQRPGTKPFIRQKLEQQKAQSVAFEAEADIVLINTDIGTINTAVSALDVRVTTLEP